MNKGGTLVIPEGIEPIRFEDGEIGRRYIVRSDSYLCANSPPISVHAMLNDENTPTEINRLGNGAKKFPALLVEKKKGSMIGVTGQVKAGEIVLARDVPGDSTVMQVATFETTGKVHDDMPETGNGIVIKNKGYMLKSQLSPDPSNAESFNRPLLNQFRSIFPNDNLRDDVHQYKFGDCFLLASVLAILNQEGGEEYIKSIMVQKGDSTIVRLFDPNDNTFVYYEISNTFHQQSGQNNVLHKAPWVHILEKAYAAHAYKKNNSAVHDKRKFIPTFPAFTEVFGSGGHPDVALTILTGSPAKEHMVRSAINIPWEPQYLSYCANIHNKLNNFINEFNKDEILQIDRLLSEFSEDKNEIDYLLKLIGANSNSDEYYYLSENTKLALSTLNQMISPKIFSIESQEDREAFMSSFSEYVVAHRNLRQSQDLSVVLALSNLWNMAQLGKYYIFIQDIMPQDDFKDMMESIMPSAEYCQFDNANITFERFQRLDPRPPEDVIYAFRRYFSLDGYTHRWDGKLGTGIYSDDSLAVHAEISQHFNSASQSNAIVASAKFKACPDSLGLRPQHAYAVVGAPEKTINGRVLKFITVRNPWGHTGRLYDWDQREVIATESNTEKAATFDVELSDFTRYFYKYTVGNFQVAPVQDVEATTNINYSRYIEGAIIGLIMGSGVGIALAVMVSLVCLPIIVGLSLLVGTFFITEALAEERAKSEMRKAGFELKSVTQNNSSTFWKSSTSRFIERFDATEEVLSRADSQESVPEKPIPSKTNGVSAKSKVVVRTGRADELELRINVESMFSTVPCR